MQTSWMFRRHFAIESYVILHATFFATCRCGVLLPLFGKKVYFFFGNNIITCHYEMTCNAVGKKGNELDKMLSNCNQLVPLFFPDGGSMESLCSHCCVLRVCTHPSEKWNRGCVIERPTVHFTVRHGLRSIRRPFSSGLQNFLDFS